MNGDLERALRRAVRGEVRFDAYTRHLCSRDASMYAIEPAGVVLPRDADDVAAAVAVAAEFSVPVLARGAGTSLAGQAVGPGVVLDLSRHMDAILAIDAEARAARVQPGVVQDRLNRAAAGHGLMFGPDTSTADRATLGGMIGNNSAGSGSVRHGMTIDHVRELEVVLADASRARLRPVAGRELAALAAAATLEGSLYRELPGLLRRHAGAIAAGYPRYWRQSGGYRLDWLAGMAGPGSGDGRPAGTTGPAGPRDGSLNLATLVTGAEGTLAIVTEATVGLVPRPACRAIAVGHFRSVQEAIEATGPALEAGPDAVELIDRFILDLSRARAEYRALGSILRGDPEALLFVTASGGTPGEAAAALDRVEAAWRRGGHGYHVLRAAGEREQAAVLRVRRAGLGLLMAASRGSLRPVAFIEDTAVPPARLAEYARRLREITDRAGLTAGFYGHASVGCLHVRPFLDLAEPGQARLMREVAARVRALAAEFGGVNSSEHGDGLARSEFNEAVFGTALYQAMCEVKRLFDPAGLLNPGKITGAGPMTEHLRMPPRPAVPLRTRLAFGVAGPAPGVTGGPGPGAPAGEGTQGPAAQGPAGAGRGRTGAAMLAAADRCMNIGLCRKGAAGVMCPSYMATREEEHSTRGRAGALVKALAAADPRAALAGERLHEILDLCLGCKACASECPLGVDIASLKAEALAAYHDVHGVPLRARAFASAGALNRLGAAAAPLANALARARPVRRAARRFLGITADRPLPRFERGNGARRLAGRPGPGASPARGTLIFLADSFTSHTDTAVPRAAVELLARAGWRVETARPGCCGRASISCGLLDQARRRAARLARRLAGPGGPVTAGALVTGAEPSCLLALRDEYPRLLPDDERAAAVAASVRPPEDLLAEAIADGSLRLPEGNPLAGRRIVFHGHCHQKAVTGTAAAMALLRAIPGARVTELDAGCCGMAGSFGYEAEHYELSMRIGELRLFPALRAQPAGTLVAATGVSCRQQIRHGTGLDARHPAELVLAALGGAEPAPRGTAGAPGGAAAAPG